MSFEDELNDKDNSYNKETFVAYNRYLITYA